MAQGTLSVPLAVLVAAGLITEEQGEQCVSALGRTIPPDSFHEIVEQIRLFVTPANPLPDQRLTEAIAAIETKLGVDNSEDESSIDYRVRQLESKQPLRSRGETGFGNV